ncbi:MAG: hypothetical protein NVSMB57_01380 [Actinomycetota bacterium]
MSFLASRGRIPALIVVCLALLFAAVTAGLQIPGLGVLSPFREGLAVDYSAGPPGGFSPIEPRLVASLLGQDVTVSPRKGAGPPPSPETRPLGTIPDAGPVDVSHKFTNGRFSDAYAVPSVPFRARTTPGGATPNAGEPKSCGVLPQGSAWYSFTPHKNVGLIANTFGTASATSLTVYQGTALNNLVRVGDCSSDASGNALVPFAAKRGVGYFVQVQVPINGDLVFALEEQGITSMVSIGRNGERANGDTIFPSISADGTIGTFMTTSSKSTFDPSHDSADTFCLSKDIVGTIPSAPLGCDTRTYVVDLSHRDIRRADVPTVDNSLVHSPVSQVDVAYEGAGSVTALPSANGRYVAFTSSRPLRPGDTTRVLHVYRRDLWTDRIDLVSERCTVDGCPAGTGQDPNGDSVAQDISEDGRYVLFSSKANNIVPNDNNQASDAFVRDMKLRKTIRVSVGDHGQEANGLSTSRWFPGETGSTGVSLSGNGRFVKFISAADNLVPNDTNDAADVFLHDIVLGTTVRVSVPDGTVNGNAMGGESALAASHHSISDDGRYVFFVSQATNLVQQNTAGVEEFFVRDVLLGRTRLVSVDSHGIPGNKGASAPDLHSLALDAGGTLVFQATGWYNISLNGFSVSRDGRYAVFSSDADNLVPGDHNAATDVFLRDLQRGTTIRVSTAGDGSEGNGASVSPDISADGKTIVFSSLAKNFVNEPSHNVSEIFVKHLPASSL